MKLFSLKDEQKFNIIFVSQRVDKVYFWMTQKCSQICLWTFPVNISGNFSFWQQVFLISSDIIESIFRAGNFGEHKQAVVEGWVTR